ncbi:hypothetical protein GTY57_25185 [Streptomyces sp. SID5475]|nr:hypothetical protein TR66_18415 [Streptomyces sp. WM6391]MZE80142.1 hypothetical protein [Streptomyces sp. SID5475]
MLGHLLTATFAALGTFGAALGAGLSLIGLCCSGPALATATAGGAATGATATATPVTWPLWASGAVLLTAAALWHRRHRTAISRRLPPPSAERPHPSGPTGPYG